MTKSKEEFPRRARVDRWSREEKAIAEAIRIVEEAGADVLLTRAVVLLGEAQSQVADWIDAQGQVKPCPFCGIAPEVAPWNGGEKPRFMVSCANLECVVSPAVIGDDRKNATERWNRRAPGAVEAEG